MNDELDTGIEPAAPVWAVFGDLMSVLLGAFVLVLVGAIGLQLELSAKLEEEVLHRQEETQRRISLEQALARPLAEGSVRSEEHTSELQSLMRISYAVFCLKKKK